MGDSREENQQHNHSSELDIGFRSASPSAMIASSSMNKESGSYDMAELDQALFLYLDGHDQSPIQEQRLHLQRTECLQDFMCAETLNIFPSQPMHVEPVTAKGGGGTALVPNGSSSSSKRPSGHNTIDQKSSTDPTVPLAESGKENKGTVIKREGINSGKGTTSSSEQEGPKTPDPKTLRRLAQNREAARKSRLRKKAYIQQLESSRIRLSQLEQELQMARTQGMFLGSGALVGEQGGLPVGLSPDAAMFDVEYGRWLEEHHKLMCQLRAAVEEHLPENQLQMFVDGALAQHDVLTNLKGMVAKSDFFHLMSGMWATPAERCFLWMGGFRPSELIKIVLKHIEPLSEQQILGICSLQQSIQETEDALNHGLEALQQSLSDTITSDVLSSAANFMGHMSMAMNKLSSMEGFVRQADNLRQQTLHKLHQLLTTRQAARCYLAIAEYFHRLRALSSLWVARPRQDGM